MHNIPLKANFMYNRKLINFLPSWNFHGDSGLVWNKLEADGIMCP